MLLATAVPFAPLLRLLVLDILEQNELLQHTKPAKKTSTIFNYIIFARLDFSGLGMLEHLNMGPGELPSPGGQDSQQAGQAAATEQPPASQMLLKRSTATLEERVTYTGSAFQEVKGRWRI